MVCTSNTWCNNMFDCIDRESIPDESTYDYISDRTKLINRDNILIKVDDSKKLGEDDEKYIWPKFINYLVLFIVILL